MLIKLLFQGKGRANPFAPIADHITPHKGSLPLFLDLANVQTLCKRCHDQTKAQIEARGYSGDVDAIGWPIDPKHPANRRS